MAPAIKLAEEGFVISPTLAERIADNFDAIQKNEALAAIMCREGLPLEAGRDLEEPGPGAKPAENCRGRSGSVLSRGAGGGNQRGHGRHGGFISKRTWRPIVQLLANRSEAATADSRSFRRLRRSPALR